MGNYDEKYMVIANITHELAVGGLLKEGAMQEFEDIVGEIELDEWAKERLIYYFVLDSGAEYEQLKELMLSMPFYESDTQYVYLIVNPQLNIHKIGVTRNIGKRVSQLSNASGVVLEVCHFIRTRRNPHHIESDLHHHYHSSRLEGEWFKDIDPQEWISVLKQYDDPQ